VPIMQSVTSMAEQLADSVNTQLAAGYALDGSPGTDLFEFDSSGATGMLKVRPGIVGAELAFSADPATPGNSQNLLALIALKREPVVLPTLGTVSRSDAMTQLVARLGTESQRNTIALDTAETVRNQAEESWKATSGVNLDEEAANVMQYQQMYQANMKVIAVANELFDSTLAILG
jgi:flagellar hook-associated protein 1